MLGDIQSKRPIVIKGILFVAIGSLSAALLLIDRFEWRTAALLTVCVWAFCRAYYFVFYVITNYLDSGFKYSEIFSALRHLWRSRGL